MKPLVLSHLSEWQLLRGAFKMPRGHGCVYLLESKAVFKVGSSVQPWKRCPEQRCITGHFKRSARVESFYIGDSIEGFREKEKWIHGLLMPWRVRYNREGGWEWPVRDCFEKRKEILVPLKTLLASNFSEKSVSSFEREIDSLISKLKPKQP